MANDSNAGIMWYGGNTKSPLADKLPAAIAAYKRHSGLWPTHVELNTNDYAEIPDGSVICGLIIQRGEYTSPGYYYVFGGDWNGRLVRSPLSIADREAASL